MTTGVSDTVLLAAGLFEPYDDLESATAGELLDRLRELLRPSALWTRLGHGQPPAPAWPGGDGRLPQWRHPEPAPGPGAAALLEEAWSRLLSETGGWVDAVRVEVDSLDDARTLRGLTGLVSGNLVSPIVRVPGHRLTWHWPIRLGVVGPESWAAGLRGDEYHGEHFTLDSDGPPDVVLVDASDGMPQDPSGMIATASAVIAVGDAAAADLFDTVAGRVSAPMVAAVPGTDLSWWHSAWRELSHDLPLDVVLRILHPEAVVGGVGTAYDVTAVAHWASALVSREGGMDEVEAMIVAVAYDAESAGARQLGKLIRTAAPGAVVEATFDLPLTAGAAPGAPPVPAAPAPAPEERRVHALVEHAGARRNTFVAGAENTIRCWIGPPEATTPMADRPIPTMAIPDEGLDVTVELRWGGGEPGVASLLLPADRGARSNDALLRLSVPADLARLEAELVFSYRGRCVELVRLEADVLPADAPDHETPPTLTVGLSRPEVVDLSDSEPCTARLTYAGGMLGVYAGDGGRTFTLDAPAEAMERLATELFTTDKQLVRQRAAQPGGEPVLDVGDEQVLLLLRELARFGAGLHHQLDAQGLADPGDRIQLLTLDATVIVPLELVYDRGYPSATATLCDGWLGGALAPDAIECSACSGRTDEGRFAPVICPLGFWAFRKVIERWDPDMAVAASAPTSERRELPALDSAVFACSGKVTQDEQDATWEAIRSRIATSTYARDWDQWHQAVRSHPRLLVALPHHGEGEFQDYLQIGEEGLSAELGRLERGMINAGYVNPDRREPGPLLLLLGCATATVTELGYLQLVRTFERHRTAIVLGTLSQVLGRNAAPLARELVTQLVAAELPATDFGSLLRTVRRSMMLRGHMLALGVVALGDAEWRLTPTPAVP